MKLRLGGSIVIPIYNAENYLRECLDFVVAQTERSIEVILVDDCSSDGSVAIAERDVQSDTRFRLLRHAENLGVSESRNTGIRESTGQYLLFVDCDDFLASTYCEKLISAIEESNADVAFCKVDLIEADGSRVEYPACNKQLEDSDKTTFPVSDAIVKAVPCVVWNKIFRRAIVDGVNLRFSATEERG